MSLEKIKGDSKSIKSLTKDDGTQVDFEPSDILNQESAFYKKLYTSHRVQNPSFEENNINFVKNLKIPLLNEEAVAEIANEITEDDLYQAIRLSSDNKRPGTNGQGNTFYKHFWPPN